MVRRFRRRGKGKKSSYLKSSCRENPKSLKWIEKHDKYHVSEKILHPEGFTYKFVINIEDLKGSIDDPKRLKAEGRYTVTLNIVPLFTDIEFLKADLYGVDISKESEDPTFPYLDTLEYGRSITINYEQANAKKVSSVINKYKKLAENVEFLIGFYLDKPVNRLGDTGWDQLKKWGLLKEENPCRENQNDDPDPEGYSPLPGWYPRKKRKTNPCRENPKIKKGEWIRIPEDAITGWYVRWLESLSEIEPFEPLSEDVTHLYPEDLESIPEGNYYIIEIKPNHTLIAIELKHGSASSKHRYVVNTKDLKKLYGAERNPCRENPEEIEYLEMSMLETRGVKCPKCNYYLWPIIKRKLESMPVVGDPWTVDITCPGCSTSYKIIND